MRSQEAAEDAFSRTHPAPQANRPNRSRTTSPKLASGKTSPWSRGPRGLNNDPCVVLAGINALLAGADACAQRNKNADAMVGFAKLPGINNKQALIDNAVAYLKHPPNALNNGGVVPSTLFCETAPRNPELNGVVNGPVNDLHPLKDAIDWVTTALSRTRLPSWCAVTRP